MVDRFVRKLAHASPLTPADIEALSSLALPARTLRARTDILHEGDEARFIPIILSGWAARYRLLENGKRQIVSLFVPGDLCEPFGVLPRFMAKPVGTLTPVAFAPVPLAAIGAAARFSPRIMDALWWDLLIASSIEREHLVSLGRRSASERMGHFFCELHLRLERVGLVDGLGYDLPITQADISDLLGISAVHVNRSLQDLRKSGLISLHDRRLTIHDLKGLRDLSFFEPAYLHSDGSTALVVGERESI